MTGYPPYQPTQNAYQIAGQAIQQGSGVFDKMASLIEKRKQNLIKQRNDEIEAERVAEVRRREDERYQREQDELKRQQEFREKIASGKSAKEGETKIPYSPDEIMQEGLQSSIIDPIDYAKATKERSEPFRNPLTKISSNNTILERNPNSGEWEDTGIEVRHQKQSNQNEKTKRPPSFAGFTGPAKLIMSEVWENPSKKTQYLEKANEAITTGNIQLNHINKILDRGEEDFEYESSQIHQNAKRAKSEIEKRIKDANEIISGLTSLDSDNFQQPPQDSVSTNNGSAVPPQIQQALDWLKANPNSPHAEGVRKKLQSEGYL